MNPTLNVYALPTLAGPDELAGATVVVIDVLRAATTIIHALDAGATAVIPCSDIPTARQLADQHPKELVVLGGEQNGLPIEGFDLGNSPSEYVPDRVAGKVVIFTTTNGTKAMLSSSRAGRVLIAAFVNASSVAERLSGSPRICLLCAGTENHFSRDDVLLAGLLVDRLQRHGGIQYRLNAQAITARENWTASFAVPYVIGAEPLPPELLVAQLEKSEGGRRLIDIGAGEDIRTAAQLDRFSIVPEMDTRNLTIRVLESGS